MNDETVDAWCVYLSNNKREDQGKDGDMTLRESVEPLGCKLRMAEVLGRMCGDCLSVVT